jgi:membrane protease YdiL (CAAX protease family)
MPQEVDVRSDLKTAAVLAGTAGIFGAVTVPLLLPAVFERVSPEQRALPIPLPLFCVAIAVQFLIVYGMLALLGLRLARARDREPAPLLTAVWTRTRVNRFASPASLAFATGILCGLALIVVIALIQRFAPHTLPDLLHPSSLWGALSASAAASFSEEILFRLFVLGALLRILPMSSTMTAIAVVTSSLLFGAFHAPAAIFLFGGLQNVPPLFWVWMVVLNGLIGIACAAWFLRAGIGAAILVHFGADLVWHVLSQGL